jgi:hypothetical protein
MSGTKRRQRKERARAREAAESGERLPPPPQPDWAWRTFPVFFAFAAGGFLSLLIGVISGALGLTIVFAVFGGMLGFGLSRLGTRALVNRGIIKPRG